MSLEFIEQIKAAFHEIGKAIKKILEWLAKLELPEYKEKARFRIDKGKNLSRFNITAYGWRYKPP